MISGASEEELKLAIAISDKLLLQQENEDLRKENTRLLELCMYALIRDTKIYNHELDYVTRLKLMDIVKNNLTEDTYTLRKRLISFWKECE